MRSRPLKSQFEAVASPAEGAHTPGPWEAVGWFVRTKDYDGKRGGLLVADTSHGFGDASANARLIAAAPDFAVAANDVLSAYAEVAGDIAAAMQMDERWERLARAVLALDEANRKARGAR